jgi:hypothetical protein
LFHSGIHFRFPLQFFILAIEKSAAALLRGHDALRALLGGTTK